LHLIDRATNGTFVIGRKVTFQGLPKHRCLAVHSVDEKSRAGRVETGTPLALVIEDGRHWFHRESHF